MAAFYGMNRAPDADTPQPSPIPAAMASLWFGFMALATLAIALRYGFGFGVLYLLKTGALYALVALLVMHSLSAHPHPRFGLANQITLARAILVALLFGLVTDAEAIRSLGWWIVGTAVLVEVLDGVDGRVARREGSSSPFGARFDMEIDALFILVLALLVWRAGYAGAWVLLAGALRYLFVAAARVWPRLAAPLPPSRRRQAACVVPTLLLGAALAPPLGAAWGLPLAAVALAILGYSFAVDTVWLARGEHKPPAPGPR